MWLLILLVLHFPVIKPQIDIPEVPDLPDFPELPDFPFDFNIFDLFTNPCSCEASHCDCCIDISIIDQKGCLRVTIRNNRIRVSFVLNDVDIGGFSTQFPNINNSGITLQLPCTPSAALTLGIRNRSRSSRRRFCINALARGIRMTWFNRDFCFDVNGNNLTPTSSRIIRGNNSRITRRRRT